MRVYDIITLREFLSGAPYNTLPSIFYISLTLSQIKEYKDLGEYKIIKNIRNLFRLETDDRSNTILFYV